MPAPVSHKLIALAGFMGCGKTTVGRLLAERLGWRFVDLDTRIVERAQAPIVEIFRLRGEPAFRRIESEVLENISTRRLELNFGHFALTPCCCCAFFHLASSACAALYIRLP